ncbi:MAG: MarR family winged helix-turn-helix transcriptional regulator [Actinomycetota bacterium]|nr:MarR family winged helix-turn-helix transcriptional regulator [Actinomycetota bacterium]
MPNRSPLLETDTVGAELLSVVARLHRFATHQAGIDVPFAQVRLLALVEESGASRVSELAALDRCTQPTMTAQVKRLEAAGLVTRVTDPSDARAVLVSTTPAGHHQLEAAREARAAAVAPYLATLEPQEHDVLAAAVPILRRLLADASTPSTTSHLSKEQ